jgi:KaiC/GvpD/RAD55 family RecA-like ATPase
MSNLTPTPLRGPKIFNVGALFKQLSYGLTIEDAPTAFPPGSNLLVAGPSGVGKTFFALALVRELMRSNPSAELYLITVDHQIDKLSRQYEAFGWFSRSDLVFNGADQKRVRIIPINEGQLPQPTRGAEELINPVLTRVRRLQVDRQEEDDSRPAFVVLDNLTTLVKDSRDLGDRQRNLKEIVDRLAEILSPRLCLTLLISSTLAEAAAAEEDIATHVFRLRLEETGSRWSRVFDIRKAPDAAPLLRGEHTWEVLTPVTLDEVVAFADLQSEIKKWQADPKQDADQPDAETTPKRWATLAIIPHARLTPIGRLQDVRPATGEGQLSTANPDIGHNVLFNATVIPTRLFTGVPGLDEMIRGDTDFWARPIDRFHQSDPKRGADRWKKTGGLYSGSATFLLGRSGTGKTNACLQFLTAHGDLSRCLYVNFENRPHRIHQWFPGSEDAKDRLARCRFLYRRRSQLDRNLLMSELFWIVRRCRIERIALDGLSDLQTVLTPREYSQLVEELIVCIREANFKARVDNFKARVDSWRASPPGTTEPARETDYERWNPQPITIIVSLEADPTSDIVSQYLSYSYADNVVALRQVAVNDQLRKTIVVPKARGQAPDPQVREVVVAAGHDYPLRVIPGLDNYRQLTGPAPKPVRLTLQCIAESPVQQAYNDKLINHLVNQFGYKIRRFGFSSGDLIRTLEDIAAGLTRIPFSDVKLLTIDEWWVRELRAREAVRGRTGVAAGDPKWSLASTRHPLLRLNPFLYGGVAPGLTAADRVELCAQAFWAVEIEKAAVPILTEKDSDKPVFRADVVALPNSMDFGLMGLNANRVPNDVAPTGGGQQERAAWETLLPRVWAARTDDNWFRSPGSGDNTVADFLSKALSNQAEQRELSPPTIGFCFDMETPVTTTCVFLELCWAYGAPEEIFVRDLAEYASAKDKSEFIRHHPATWAVKLLQFFVVEELMPPRTTLQDTRRAILSRLWYSNIPEVDPKGCPPVPPKKGAAGDKPGSGATPRPEPRQEGPSGGFLRPIPYFPLGVSTAPTAPTAPAAPADEDLVSDAVLVCVHDAANRFARLIDRLRSVVAYRREVIPGDDGSIIRSIRAAEEAFLGLGLGGLFDFARRSPFPRGRPPAAPFTYGRARRVCELLLTQAGAIEGVVVASPLFNHGLGLEHTGESTVAGFLPPQHPEGGTGEQHWRHLPYAMFMDLRDAAGLFRWHRRRLRFLHDELGRSAPNEGTGFLTGFCCEGSWLVGVDRATRSPDLAAKFLTEITSLHQAEQKARIGAGIPALKDFYDLHGGEFVPCFPPEWMTWDDFLDATLARARRRSRAFCARLRTSDVFTFIDQRLFACLTLAALKGERYRESAPGRAAVVGELTAAAESTVKALFELLAEQMRTEAACDSSGSGPSHCVTCPNPDGCKGVFHTPEAPASPE